jgi:hypothetical protein
LSLYNLADVEILSIASNTDDVGGKYLLNSEAAGVGHYPDIAKSVPFDVRRRQLE